MGFVPHPPMMGFVPQPILRSRTPNSTVPYVGCSVGWVERSDTHHWWVERSDTHHWWVQRSDTHQHPIWHLTMTSYRRNFIPGASYFFTVNLNDRRSRLLVDHVAPLRAAFRAVRARHPFMIDAVVVLPDHLHAIWTLPPGDADFATRWRLIKSGFSRSLAPHEPRSASRVAKGERSIWQRRYWEHTLRDELDFERHCDYIHFNPVKHGHAGAVRDWPYSSFPRFVKLGVYPIDWGTGEPIAGIDRGERRPDSA